MSGQTSLFDGALAMIPCSCFDLSNSRFLPIFMQQVKQMPVELPAPPTPPDETFPAQQRAHHPAPPPEDDDDDDEDDVKPGSGGGNIDPDDDEGEDDDDDEDEDDTLWTGSIANTIDRVRQSVDESRAPRPAGSPARYPGSRQDAPPRACA